MPRFCKGSEKHPAGFYETRMRSRLAAMLTAVFRAATKWRQHAQHVGNFICGDNVPLC